MRSRGGRRSPNRVATAIAAGSLVFASVSVLSASPAYADGYDVATNHYGGHDGVCGAIIIYGHAETYFCQDGDVFHLFDYDNDGKSVGVKWRTSTGRSGLCRWAGGSGSAGDCNYNFYENAEVTFSAGLCNATATVDCRTWDDYTNKEGPYSLRAG